MSQLRKLLSFRSLDPSMFLAGICTAAFYTVMSLPAMKGSLLSHYTTEHAVEYVIVTLFIWGIIDIGLKLLWLPREILATRQTWLPARTGRVSVDTAASMLALIRTRPSWLLDSRIGKRITRALEFVSEKGSAEEFPEHLRYLADQDHNQSHSNYTLIRFVIAVTPILGFFGTVVHFGTAIGGFSLTDIDDKLSTLVGEMGTAFNTTAVALATAMTMTFALFLCERVERSLGATIDRLVDAELANRFEIQDANITPFLSAIQSSNQHALAAISKTLERQIEVWSKALDGLFQHFAERQGQEANRWQAALEEVRKRHETYDVEREKRLQKTFTIIDQRQDKHLAQIQAGLDKALAFRNDIGELLKTLAGIAKGEGRLVELQATLTNNLRVLHETRQIDGAVHGLTAAIHLLTARNRQVGSQDDGAAAA